MPGSGIRERVLRVYLAAIPPGGISASQPIGTKRIIRPAAALVRPIETGSRMWAAIPPVFLPFACYVRRFSRQAVKPPGGLPPTHRLYAPSGPSRPRTGIAEISKRARQHAEVLTRRPPEGITSAARSWSHQPVRTRNSCKIDMVRPTFTK